MFLPFWQLILDLLIYITVNRIRILLRFGIFSSLVRLHISYHTCFKITAICSVTLVLASARILPYKCLFLHAIMGNQDHGVFLFPYVFVIDVP